ncbi:MAG: acetate kinase [Acidobacteria bacterium]|nr:acetate kinase [Acidobacteriota bacterium]
MKVLVLNCGSSSVKYQVVETSPQQMESSTDRVLGRGTVENVVSSEAVQTAIATILASSDGIDAVGHRIVHGGERFSHSVIVTETMAREIEELSELAPLHNPHNLRGYYAAHAALPFVPQVAVFDTAFHQTLPPYAYLYALPYEQYLRHKVRRYGFHGTSYRYIAQRYAWLHQAPPERFKLICCHLGNGCSTCAIDGGRSVETSMGFTPLEGLIMGTRTGDIDAAAVLHLMDREGLDLAAIGELLNKKSGLLGLSGLSNDIRTVIEHAERGHERARLAIDAFCHRIRKYIGAHYAVLNGADALVFTGGIGENRHTIRAQVCESLEALGIAIDPEKNLAAAGREMDISAEGAKTRVWVIPTHEELLIARETMLCLLAPESR